MSLLPPKDGKGKTRAETDFVCENKFSACASERTGSRFLLYQATKHDIRRNFKCTRLSSGLDFRLQVLVSRYFTREEAVRLAS